MFRNSHVRSAATLMKWSCLSFCADLCDFGGGGTERPKSEPRVRPFAISSVQHVKLPPDARLLQDQELSQTKNKGKSHGTSINREKVPIDELRAYIESNMGEEMVQRTAHNRNNTQMTKIIQNLYVISLGGLEKQTLSRFKINLLLNATIDLPNVTVKGVTTLRVPILEEEADSSLTRYINDVADKIHENYLKNGQTVVYCSDGNRNSIALSAGYLVKYTDLRLSEALTHLKYTRKGFSLKGGSLGAFEKPLIKYAKKMKKVDSCQGYQPTSVLAKRSGKSIFKVPAKTSSAKKSVKKASIKKSQKSQKSQKTSRSINGSFKD